MIDVDGIRARYRRAVPFLDERGRRLFAANEARAGDPRRSKIVFIGRNLNRPVLRRGFEACAAA